MLQSSAGKLLQNSAEKSLAEKSLAKSSAEKSSAEKSSAEKIHCKVRPRNVAKIGREIIAKFG